MATAPAASNSKFVDVCHGDADGICSRQQLHLHQPRPETLLITGAKREIKLLERIPNCHNCQIRVLDISLDSNRPALLKLLSQGNHIFYADHHFSGEIPNSPLLEAHIQSVATLCTALIVNSLLANYFAPWAVVGAFGDNLEEEATSRAAACGLNEEAILRLRELGQLLNYNAYALETADQYVHPAKLCREVQNYTNPLRFYRDSLLLPGLRLQYAGDQARLTANYAPFRHFAHGTVTLLPKEGWARRISGLLANRLARESPDQAQAVLVPRSDGQLLVSVRAPLARPQGADRLCRQFATGGGRSAAAGINSLSLAQLDYFLACFTQHFSSATPSSELL